MTCKFALGDVLDDKGSAADRRTDPQITPMNEGTTGIESTEKPYDWIRAWVRGYPSARRDPSVKVVPLSAKVRILFTFL